MISTVGRRLIISLIVSSFLLSLIIYQTAKAKVTLVIDGEEEVIRTHAETIEDLLLSYESYINKQDLIYPALDTAVVPGMKITWDVAKEVSLSINGKEKEIWTTEEKVKNIIAKENIKITEHDKVTPELTEELGDKKIIKIEKAFPIALQVGGEKAEVWTTSTTVADLLKQQEIVLNKLDRVEPGVEELVQKDTKVNVIRVEKVTDVVEESIEPAVVSRKDSSLKAGTERVIDPGKKGLVEKHYEVILENGKEVARELIKSEEIKESKDRIVAVGTKQVNAAISRGNGVAAKEFYVKSTAYTAYCKGCSGVTATGINLRKNPHMKVIAVDPDVIPLGSKVWVEGYGYAIAGDTGGAIDGNKIDLFISDRSKALRYGSKTVKIKVLSNN